MARGTMMQERKEDVGQERGDKEDTTSGEFWPGRGGRGRGEGRNGDETSERASLEGRKRSRKRQRGTKRRKGGRRSSKGGGATAAREMTWCCKVE